MDNFDDLQLNDSQSLTPDEARILKDHISNKVSSFLPSFGTSGGTGGLKIALYLTILYIIVSNTLLDKILTTLSTPIGSSPISLLVIKTILFFGLTYIILRI